MQTALDAFREKQRAEWRALLAVSPEFVADMKQAAAYDAALRRQAFFNGIPVPKHRRA